MPKVTIKFRKTESRTSYWSENLRLSDGETAKVDKAEAERLMKFFPGNFQMLGLAPIVPSSPQQGLPVAKLTSHPLVSILIPQRGRPKQITKCLELILRNTSYPNYEIILICDKDDMNSVSAIPKNKRIRTVIDPSPARQMFVGKINYGFRISKGECIVYLANDIEVGKNWLNEAMKSMMEAFPGGAGLVAFNHGDPQKHAYHGLISRRFVNQYLKGNPFYPGYIHFWCDLELVAIARRHNKFCFSPKSRVYHKPTNDAIHAEGWRKSYKQGANLLIKRSKAGFPL